MDDKYPMLKEFIRNSNKENYFNDAAKKMIVDDSLQARFKWSWWAFFFTISYLLYRKLYVPAIVIFAVNITFTALFILSESSVMLLLNAFITYGTMVMLGSFAPYLVIRRYYFLVKKEGVKSPEVMASKGGVDIASPIVVLAVVLLASFFIN